MFCFLLRITALLSTPLSTSLPYHIHSSHIPPSAFVCVCTCLWYVCMCVFMLCLCVDLCILSCTDEGGWVWEVELRGGVGGGWGGGGGGGGGGEGGGVGGGGGVLGVGGSDFRCRNFFAIFCNFSDSP